MDNRTTIPAFPSLTAGLVRELMARGPLGATYQEQRRLDAARGDLAWWNFWRLNDERYGYPSRNPRYRNMGRWPVWPTPLRPGSWFIRKARPDDGRLSL